MAVTYRDTKGSQLTSPEVDENFRSIHNCYGQISFAGTGTNHDPGTTPIKITDFDVAVSSDGVTASAANDTLTVNKPGTYDMFVRVNAEVDDAETYTIFIAKNGVEQADLPIDIEKNLGTLSFVASGFAPGLVATDEIAIYVNSASAGGAMFTPSFLRMKLVKVGE